MAQLYIVRHAQASFGSDDYDKLSELGHQQSALLGDYFAERKITFDRVITGDMRRHKETAQGILQTQERSQENEIDARWNEFDFKSLFIEYLKLHPDEQPGPQAPRSDFYKILKKAMHAWSEKSIECPGEDWEGFVSRVHQAGKTVCSGSGKNVLVVSSGGAIAVYLMQLLGMSISKAIDFNLQIKNTSVHHLFFNQRSIQLSSFNNVPHLDHPERAHLATYS